jgi:hypothetical protein
VYVALQYQDVLFARTMMEKGLLPEPGGWAGQPYHWIQALKVIVAEVARVERQRMERLKTRDNGGTL